MSIEDYESMVDTMRLLALRVRGETSSDDFEAVWEFIDHHEGGVAVHLICDQLFGYGVALHPEDFERLYELVLLLNEDIGLLHGLEIDPTVKSSADGSDHRPADLAPRSEYVSFPRSWTRDEIMHQISDIVTDPTLPWVPMKGSAAAAAKQSGRPVRSVVTGRRHGVDVRVVVDDGPEGIITAYPVV